MACRHHQRRRNLEGLTSSSDSAVSMLVRDRPSGMLTSALFRYTPPLSHTQSDFPFAPTFAGRWNERLDKSPLLIRKIC